MPRPIVAIISAFMFASLALAANTPLDVKTGLWNMNYDMTMTGEPPRKFNAKDCVTSRDLQQGAFGNKDDEESCTYSPLITTTTRNESSIKCTDGRHGTMKVEALSREKVKGEIIMVTGKRTITLFLTGAWANASCAGADD